MSLEELRRKFIVDQDVLKARLEPVVSKALNYCVCDKEGKVHILRRDLSGRNQTMLVLAARAIASQLDPKIAPQISVSEIAAYTGLPANQIRARGKELVEARFAESPERGTYRALFHRVEVFLDSMSEVY